MTRRIASHSPVIDPRHGLRQRQRADGSWRIWWEPTAKQAKAGAVPVDLSDKRPGDAQRTASDLAKKWNSDAPKPSLRGYSVSSLILDYTASRYYTGLRATTHNTYRANLRAIELKWGPQAVAALDAPMMVAWYDALLAAKGQFRSNAILTMMGILMLHAERRGWIPKGSNPARDLGMVKPQPRKRVASAAELTALIDVADGMRPAIALALRLALVTGQRQTDLLQAKPADFRPTPLLLPGQANPVPGYVWHLVRSKRGNVGHIPVIDADTVAALTAQIAKTPFGGLLITNAEGRAYSRERFHEHFAEIRDAVAMLLPDVASLQWRDLRRTVGVQVRAAGISKDDAGDLLGNTLASNTALAQTYTPATLATTLRAVAATSLPKRKQA